MCYSLFVRRIRFREFWVAYREGHLGPWRPSCPHGRAAGSGRTRLPGPPARSPTRPIHVQRRVLAAPHKPQSRELMCYGEASSLWATLSRRPDLTRRCSPSGMSFRGPRYVLYWSVQPSLSLYCSCRCRRRTTQVRPHAFGISCDRPPTGSTVEAAAAWCLVNRRNTARPGLPGQDDHCSLTRGAPLGHRRVPCKCHAKPRPQDFSGAAAKPPTPSCFRANASVLVFGLLCIGWAELPEILDLLL